MAKPTPDSKPKTERPKPERSDAKGSKSPAPPSAKEIGGPSGPEPTRYGDWERKGICVDF
jgi:hypothetical protein